MPRKYEVPLKEKYHLWWEYLKRSEKYKTTSDLFRADQDFFDRWEERMEFLKKICQFKGAEKRRIKSFLKYLNYFGDVNRADFDYFWKTHGDEWGEKRIFDITEKIDRLWVDLVDKKKIDQKMVYMELKAQGGCVIRIDSIKDWNNKELAKEIQKIIKARETKSVEIPYISEELRFGDVKRYLQVYDLRMQENPKLKWREISKLVYPKKEWDESVERSLYIDYNNAKKIIKNVEEGFFPGKY